MSVPLDNLYSWVNSLVPNPSMVYLFHPHGSKNIFNLKPAGGRDSPEWFVDVPVICHDQEPLNYKLYEQLDLASSAALARFNQDPDMTGFWQFIGYENSNLNAIPYVDGYDTWHQSILVHSEKNSEDLEWYQSRDYQCVHYWCHAVIARDWYRFAKHDYSLRNKQPTTKFLIYNREWTNSREYRLKFAEMVVNKQLHLQSQLSIQKHAHGVLPHEYKFVSPELTPTDFGFLDQLPDNTLCATASADYCANDFVNTLLSVVLETEFYGTRIHLTEKTLRPIACGHPFILAAGPGSLEYLRSYGFKTFDPWIDESYDQEPDHLRRLEKIIESMQSISTLSQSEQQQWQQEIQSIVEYNQQWFFSQEFFDIIETELRDGLLSAHRAIVSLDINQQQDRNIEKLRAHPVSDSWYPKVVELMESRQKIIKI